VHFIAGAVFSLLAAWHALCWGGKLTSRSSDAFAQKIRQMPTDTPLETFVADYLNMRNWEDKRDFVRSMRQLGKRAYNAGQWDGVTSTWEYPLPLDMIILDDPPEEYSDTHSIDGAAAPDPNEVEYIYPEDQDERYETVCTRTTPSYYFGDVLVLASNCVWNADITMEGYLTIFGSLTVTGLGNDVWVEGKDGSNYSVTVASIASLTINSNPGYSPFIPGSSSFKVAAGSYIFVGGGNLNISSYAANSTVIGGVGGASWYGIYAAKGSDIVIDGSTSRKVYLEDAAGTSTRACIHHLGADSSDNYGKLQVKGARFSDCSNIGVYLAGEGFYSASPYTYTYMSAPISVEYSYFNGAKSGVMVENLTVNTGDLNLNLNHNSVLNYGSNASSSSHAIYLRNISISGIPYVQFNTIQGADMTGGSPYTTIYGIYLYNIIYGSGDQINIFQNTISDGVRNGMYLSDFWARTDALGHNRCYLYLNNNTIDGAVRYGIYVDRSTTGAGYCDDSGDDDILDITNNTINSDNSSANNAYCGLHLANFQTDYDGTDYEVTSNLLEGFKYDVYLAASNRNHYFRSNEFSFGDNTDSSRKMLYLNGASDITIGGAPGDGNCFRATLDGSEPNVYHIYNYGGANNIASYNDYQGPQRNGNIIDSYTQTNICD